MNTIPFYLEQLLTKASPKLSRIYANNFAILNFALIYLLGALISNLAYPPIFFPNMVIRAGLTAITEIVWLYIMTIGPLGWLWGFPVLEKIRLEEEVNQQDAV